MTRGIWHLILLAAWYVVVEGRSWVAGHGVNMIEVAESFPGRAQDLKDGGRGDEDLVWTYNHLPGP